MRTRVGRERLIERLKILGAAVLVGCCCLYAVYELYNAWAFGVIRARHTGIVSAERSPGSFWFSVAIDGLFVGGICAVAALVIWLRAGRNAVEAARLPPLVDDAKVRHRSK